MNNFWYLGSIFFHLILLVFFLRKCLGDFSRKFVLFSLVVYVILFSVLVIIISDFIVFLQDKKHFPLTGDINFFKRMTRLDKRKGQKMVIY